MLLAVQHNSSVYLVEQAKLKQVNYFEPQNCWSLWYWRMWTAKFRAQSSIIHFIKSNFGHWFCKDQNSLCAQGILRSTVWGTPTLLVNKKLWSYHKVVVLDLWWAGIWLKLSIFLPISWSQVKVSQLWASHWLKKRVISIFMKLVKRLYFCPDFCFL